YEPPTAEGTAELVPGWPLPSCPLALFPQHQAWPSVARPQVWARPAWIAVKWIPPVTGVGLRRSAPPVALPSWPRLLAPQQKARLSVLTPQTWLPPGLTPMNLVVPALTLS